LEIVTSQRERQGRVAAILAALALLAHAFFTARLANRGLATVGETKFEDLGSSSLLTHHEGGREGREETLRQQCAEESESVEE